MGEDVSKARQASERLNRLKITTVMDEKPYVFISYKSDDWELAIEEIVYTMQKTYGLSVYYDRNFEDTNESWVEAMQEHMMAPQCVGVLAFFSRNYVRSYATLLELLTSQQDECALGGQPKPIVSVFLEKAKDVQTLCQRANQKYYRANTGIKKPEWAALEECFQNFNLQKNRITPQVVKNACEEMEKLDKFEDLKVRSVISCFKTMEDVIAKNHKDYGGDRFYEMLKNTIKTVDEKYLQEQREILDDEELMVSVFDAALINLDDLRLARTTEEAQTVVQEERAADKAAESEEPVEPEAPVEAEEAAGLEEPEKADVPAEEGGSLHRRKSVTGDVRYSIYGMEYEENQSDMMLRVFAQVLKRHPECVDTLPLQAGMNCAAKKQDIVSPNTKDAKPSYFRVCREFAFPNGASVCIGTAYASADKMKKIARLLEICGEDRDVFQSAQVELPGEPKHRGRPAAKKEPEQKNMGRTKKEKNFLD